MAAHLTLDEAVAAVEKATGFAADRPVAELHGWHYGERVRILEDDDEHGIFAGDEGWLIFEEVGAVEYHNLRVSAGFVPDGQDSGDEVSLDNLESVD